MAKEYIEREALINRLEVSPLLKPTFSFGENTRSGIIDLVKRQPTANVVEVVRCKDCKKWNKRSGLCKRNSHDVENVRLLQYTRSYDFCSFGERKDK